MRLFGAATIKRSHQTGVTSLAFIAQDTACPPERIERISDPASGLEGVIVLHSTRLGPAAGGCRLRDYPDENAMIADALRLAEGMSYKNALADLPFGGGIISVAGEYLGWSENEVMRRVDAIPDRLCELLLSANVAGAPPACLASQAARSIIAAGAGVRTFEPAR